MLLILIDISFLIAHPSFFNLLELSSLYTVQAKTISQAANDSILRHPSSSGSDGDPADHQQKKRGSSAAKTNRSVTFSLGGNQSTTPTSPSVSDASLPAKSDANGALSARAKRSKRRQAKIEKDPAKKGSAMKKTTNKKTIEASIKKEYSKGSSSSKNDTTIMKKGVGGKEEEVVKVKLNTGTLYLYKGLNRRAVFVRRL